MFIDLIGKLVYAEITEYIIIRFTKREGGLSMKKIFRKALSLGLCAVMAAGAAVPAFAADTVDYKISNPYESVAELLPNSKNHYRTNNKKYNQFIFLHILLYKENKHV